MIDEKLDMTQKMQFFYDVVKNYCRKTAGE